MGKELGHQTPGAGFSISLEACVNFVLEQEDQKVTSYLISVISQDPQSSE